MDGVIQDLGIKELDAQLDEDFSKIEKILVDTRVVNNSQPTVQLVTRSIDQHPGDYYDRRARNPPPVPDIHQLTQQRQRPEER